MSTEEMQVKLDDIISQIDAFRGLFETGMEFGDFDQMEDAFNGVAQIAYGVQTFAMFTAPKSDPTRRQYALDEMG